MPPKQKTGLTAPRKLPVQDRSRHTVEAILEATAQVLVSRGYEKTTTGGVAERAGVSIGTLYQYFHNKESLMASLVDRHVGDVLAMVEAALRRHAQAQPEVLLGAVIRASLDAHRLDPKLHKVLIEQLPRTGKLEKALDLGARLSTLLQDRLQQKFEHLPRARVRMISFVLETTVEALTHRAVIDSPAWLRSGALEAEALALLAPYLRHATRQTKATSTSHSRSPEAA